MGIEPTTNPVRTGCSAVELQGHACPGEESNLARVSPRERNGDAQVAFHHRGLSVLRGHHLAQGQGKLRTQLLGGDAGLQGHSGHLVVDVGLAHTDVHDATAVGFADEVVKGILVGHLDDDEEVALHEPGIDEIPVLVREGECGVDCLSCLQPIGEVCSNRDIEPCVVLNLLVLDLQLNHLLGSGTWTVPPDLA